MTQYYQIRPKPEHNVPTDQWGAYGWRLADCVNPDYVELVVAERRSIPVHKCALVPVFEAGLVAQLDRLFDNGSQGETAMPKPSPQPLNESADAGAEPTIYDAHSKRLDDLQKRVEALENTNAILRPLKTRETIHPPFPGIAQWTCGGVTFNPTTAVMVNANGQQG